MGPPAAAGAATATTCWCHNPATPPRFRYPLPLNGGAVERQVTDGPPPCDWIGLNYYSRWVLGRLGIPRAAASAA